MTRNTPNRRWIATILAAGAVIASVWTGVRIWTTPVRYEVVEATVDGAGANRHLESRRFDDVSRYGVLPLTIPVLLAGLGAWAAYRRRGWGIVSAALVLAVFTFLGGFSIGPAYVPAVGALALAGLVAIASRKPSSSEVHGAA